MKELLNEFEGLVNDGQDYFKRATEFEISKKDDPKKWSKKEILGHLIDSGINNLQRFTEIQFENKPYKIRRYDQDELVKANDYQNSETEEVLKFWVSINHRIIHLIKQQTEETLSFPIEFYDGKLSDLKFLMVDYVAHLKHHLNQIKNSN